MTKVATALSLFATAVSAQTRVPSMPARSASEDKGMITALIVIGSLSLACLLCIGCYLAKTSDDCCKDTVDIAAGVGTLGAGLATTAYDVQQVQIRSDAIRDGHLDPKYDRRRMYP